MSQIKFPENPVTGQSYTHTYTISTGTEAGRVVVRNWNWLGVDVGWVASGVGGTTDPRYVSKSGDIMEDGASLSGQGSGTLYFPNISGRNLTISGINSQAFVKSLSGDNSSFLNSFSQSLTSNYAVVREQSGSNQVTLVVNSTNISRPQPTDNRIDAPAGGIGGLTSSNTVVFKNAYFDSNVGIKNNTISLRAFSWRNQSESSWSNHANNEFVQKHAIEERVNEGINSIQGIQGVPTGTIVAFAGSTLPNGWLFCDGADYPPSTHQNLFNVIGTTYGSEGNNFRVPDLRTRVPVGVGTSFIRGNFGGSATVTLDINQIPNHRHGFSTVSSGRAVNDGSPSKGIDAANNPDNYEPNIFRADRQVVGLMKNPGSNTGLANGEGVALSHNNMQPYLVVNYIIKT